MVWHDGTLWAWFSQFSDFSHHRDYYQLIAGVFRDLQKIWLFNLVDRILTYRPFCVGFDWITALSPASAGSPFFHQPHKIVTWIFEHSSPLVYFKGENCCRFVFSTPSFTFKALSGGLNSSFDKNRQTGCVVTTVVAFTGSPAGWEQNLGEDQVEICPCAKIRPNPSSRCSVKLFQSWSLSSERRRPHGSLWVVCGGRQVLRWTRAVPGRGLEGPRCTCPHTAPAPRSAAAAAAERRLRPSRRCPILDRFCSEAGVRSLCMVGGPGWSRGRKF